MSGSFTMPSTRFAHSFTRLFTRFARFPQRLFTRFALFHKAIYALRALFYGVIFGIQIAKLRASKPIITAKVTRHLKYCELPIRKLD